MDSREEAILKTLLYSNLFDFPLTEEEICRFLLHHKITKNQLRQILKNKTLPIERINKLFYLKGRRKIVENRLRKEEISLNKLAIAKKIIKKISIIPTIKLIGISGTLAMKNCSEDDDIDIFVIAENGLTWTTRLLTAILLIILKAYRNKKSTRNKNKICLNLILDEKRMQFENQDLFTAHEIVQLLPIFERNKTYQKFMNANKWVNAIFPNIEINKNVLFKKQFNIFDRLFILISKIIFLEKVLKTLQLFYMRKAITKEKLEDEFIGLHPFDYRAFILKKYNAQLSKFSLK